MLHTDFCSIFGAHNCASECASGPDVATKSYLLEVLLSYRLLFGQEKRSHKLYQARERLRVKDMGSYDPLLDHLCARKSLPDDSTCVTASVSTGYTALP